MQSLGLFDYVVIYKVTRIMRNRLMRDGALPESCCASPACRDPVRGRGIATGLSGVLQLMPRSSAEWESAIDSERIRDGIQKNAQRCAWRTVAPLLDGTSLRAATW